VGRDGARGAGRAAPLAALVSLVLDFVYPPICLACDGLFSRGEELVCPECWRAASRPAARVRSLDAAVAVRAAVAAGPTLFAILHEAKYRGRRELLDPLGALLARCVAADETLCRAELFVPVPLHPCRLRERGYNQSEILARAAAGAARPHGAARAHGAPRVHGPASLGEPDCAAVAGRLLIRSRDTRPQARLPEAGRLANVRGAFRMSSRRPPTAPLGRVVIVDDVVTSGATALECARVLLDAGAEEVSVLALVAGAARPR